MSGILVPILPKQRFDFTWLSSSASKSIVLHTALNVVPYYYLRFALRLHAASTSPLTGTQSVVLAGYGTDPSSEDPAEFTKSSAALSVTLNSSSSIPSLNSATASDPDPFLKIMLTFTQTSSTGAPFWVELSADMIGRTA
ncbi:MAG: hypothetical protein H6711_25030 [Myxococcales bacterium]|nr:hypothetical protein [Myxococcales bacterium]